MDFVKRIKTKIIIFIRFRIPVLRWLVYEENGEVYVMLFRAAHGEFIWTKEFIVKKVCHERSYSRHTTKMDKAISDRLDNYINNCSHTSDK